MEGGFNYNLTYLSKEIEDVCSGPLSDNNTGTSNMTHYFGFQEYDACNLVKKYNGPPVDILCDQVCGY